MTSSLGVTITASTFTFVSTQSEAQSSLTDPIVTVTETGPTHTTSSAPRSGLDSSTIIALGVGIPVGIILLILLGSGAFIFGKRTSTRRCGGFSLHGMFKRRTQIELDEGNNLHESLRFELPGEDMVRELPTEGNIQDMEVVSEPVELLSDLPEGSRVLEHDER